jgi:hypothetical protein
MLAVCCPASADYRGGNYKIADFAGAAVAVPQRENDIIKGSVDSTLTTIDSISRISLRPGQVIMRKKLRSETYGFFSGILDTAAFSMRPPLYSFAKPHWARLEDMLAYRIFRSPTEAIGADEPIVYFDNERLYSRSASLLYYFRNGIWFQLSGIQKKPAGSISVTSHPAGADVIINGNSSGKTTPCTVNDLVAGEYSVEVQLSNYQFFRKTVRIIPDSTVSASFELIADVDTVFITGDVSYGLLLLPEPPADKPYLIDDSIRLYSTRIRLATGLHRIRWDGDELFVPLDTTIDIPLGKVVYFDYLFRRRFGVVQLIPFPADAEICIDNFGCSSGERIEELPSGLYNVDVYRLGFKKMRVSLHVIPDTITTTRIDLRQVRDSDGDGYLDSVDNCPDKYGLYNGCPTPHLASALKGAFSELREFIAADSLTMGFSLIGTVARMPVNRNFRNFISVFSSGKAGGMNNYRGLSILNSTTVTYHGLFGGIELGQWSAGLQYQRSDTLSLDGTHGVFFDSLTGVEPRMYIPSTAVAAGFHFDRAWLDIVYAIGYQWEDIIIDQIYDAENMTLEQAVFDNDWWFHQVRFEVDFNNGDMFMPSLYGNFRFPFGPQTRTRWIMMNFGFQLKICTRPKKSMTGGRYE